MEAASHQRPSLSTPGDDAALGVTHILDHSAFNGRPHLFGGAASSKPGASIDRAGKEPMRR